MNWFRGMTFLFEDIMIKVAVSDLQASEARLLSKNEKSLFGDAIHAIVTRDSNAILISKRQAFQLISGYLQRGFARKELI